MEGCRRWRRLVLWEEPIDLTGKPGVRKTSLWDGMEEEGISPKSEPSGTGVHGLAVLRKRTNGSEWGWEREERLCTLEGTDGVPLAAGLFC